MKPMNMLETAFLAAQHVMRPAPPVAPVPIPAAPVHIPDGKREMIDPGAFFAAVRKITGALDQVQVDVINRVLSAANHWPSSWLAYALATAWHECRFRPVPEIGKGRGRKYGKPGKWYGQVPYGRGLPQLTWDYNYEWADAALGLNGRLLRNFDLALDPDISARLMVIGMETGAFTGKALTIAADVTGIAADLRPGSLMPPRAHPAKPKVASFAVAPRASTGADDPAGWTLTLSDEASADVPVGSYVVDARMTFAGGTVLVTDPLPIRCVEPATVPA